MDVIVSEWLAGYGVDEDIFVPLLAARDRWLKPGGRMVPQTVTAVLAPVYDPGLDTAITFLRSRPYDLDLDLVADGNVEEVRYGVQHIFTEHPLAPGQPLWTTDSLTCSLERASSPFTASLRFSAARRRLQRARGLVYCGCGFRHHADERPRSACHIWGRTVFPLSRRIEVALGTEIAVEFTFVPEHPDERFRYGGWSVSVDGGAWEHHGCRQESVRQDSARSEATKMSGEGQG